jgi:hypothetical protein
VDAGENAELLERRAGMDDEHVGSEFAGCESRARIFIKLMATLDPLLAVPGISPEDDMLHGDLHAVIEPDRPYVPQVQQWKSEVTSCRCFVASLFWKLLDLTCVERYVHSSRICNTAESDHFLCSPQTRKA